jgi:dTDP-4-dehydrorhamnose 3,5-epimerase-like enzyme
VSLARARTVELPTHQDPRGFLTVVEGGSDVPFEIRRIFYLYETTAPFERGGHAHPDTEQLLICMHSRMRVDLMDGVSSETFTLSRPNIGLYIPPMIWTRLYDFTAETVLVVAASTHYDEPKVVRQWDDYLSAVGRR